MKFNTKYQHTRLDGIQFTEPSLTEHQFAFESNINNVINGIIPTNIKQDAKFGLQFKPNQYEEALQIVADAKNAFENLPSDIRNRFHNSPTELLEFVNDEKNYKEGVSLGIFKGDLLEKMEKAVNATSQPTTELEKPVVTEVSSQ